MPSKTSKKNGNRMQSATHLRALAPIPESAYDNPVEWSANHLEKQLPTAAKELEWQLKFGDARSRKEVAIEMLAYKGISSKGINTGIVVPAIQLIMNGPLPWTQVVEGTVVTELPAGEEDDTSH